MIAKKHFFRRVHDAFIALFHREAGAEAPAYAEQACADPWTDRGIRDAMRRLHFTENDIQETAGYSFAYSTGAHEALRLARAILSDPQVKGHEAEALRMVEQGLSHSEIVAALRAVKPASASTDDGVVVAFPPRR